MTDRKEYMAEYHREYRFLKKLESGVMRQEKMSKLKKKIGEYVDEELKIKLLNLEKELQERKLKQLDFMKRCIKFIQENPNSVEFHKLIERIDEMEDLEEYPPLDKKIKYYEEILDGL
jgi:hypothetical protein